MTEKSVKFQIIECDSSKAVGDLVTLSWQRIAADGKHSGVLLARIPVL